MNYILLNQMKIDALRGSSCMVPNYEYPKYENSAHTPTTMMKTKHLITSKIYDFWGANTMIFF